MTPYELSSLIDERQRRIEISAVVLAEAFLERIAQIQPLVNAFIMLTPEIALADAKRVDDARARGAPLPLDGLPIAIKDNIDVAGVRTTVGSKFFENAVAGEDAEVVRRLRHAGAVVLGKTNMHEFAFGTTTNNPFYGACRNPWSLDRIPGGSSGGSGAALAADLCIGALGTDSGGSVRIPAALSGVTGLRPTYGAVSSRGTFPLTWTFDAVGPMARSALDVAHMFSLMVGYDEGDPRSVKHPPIDPLSTIDDGVQGVRVGLAEDFFFDQVDPEVALHVRAAAGTFAELGAVVTPITIPDAHRASEISNPILWAEAFAVHRQRYLEQPEFFGNDTRKRLGLGERVTGADFGEALQQMYEWRRGIQRAFGRVDLVLSPSASTGAPRIDEAETVSTTAALVRLHHHWSLAHLPALSIPCGLTSEGLPIGVQVAARAWEEPLLLRAAAAFQGVTDWHRRRAPLSIKSVRRDV